MATSDHYDAIQAQQRAAAETLASRDPATLDQTERATLDGYYRAGIIGTAAQTATADTVRPLAGTLPPTALLAASAAEHTLNPKIWDTDLKRYKPIHKVKSSAWRAFVGRLVNTRKVGEEYPTPARIWAVADVIERAAREFGGKIEMPYVEIARLARCCIDTAFLAVKFLDLNGALDVFNNLDRSSGKKRRGPNCYLLWIPEEKAEELSPALRRVARFQEKLERWAPAFGLVARAWGLNATPLSSRDTLRAAAHAAARNDPAPA
jgi:hypothetical protein